MTTDRIAVTDQQRALLQLLADGLLPKCIARQRGVSIRTVQRHIADLYRTLGAHTAAHAVHLAHQHGLLPATTERTTT